ncbi:MAG: diacylglycerol kinase family protein [Ruminococcaceae bacterium]|nr:diacylglycerol kinase family protein [Oscillospiraceae bacterium]
MTKSKNGYKKLFMSFVYAFKGIYRTIKNEQNMRVHIVCMAYMYSYLFLFDFFKITRTELAIILIANALVIASEVINTAIENAVDAATDEFNKKAMLAKDAAAGAVLVFAIFAVLVGIVILWQPDAFRQLFAYYLEKPIRIGGFVLSVVIFSLFIFKGLPPYRKNQE